MKAFRDALQKVPQQLTCYCFVCITFTWCLSYGTLLYQNFQNGFLLQGGEKTQPADLSTVRHSLILTDEDTTAVPGVQ